MTCLSEKFAKKNAKIFVKHFHDIVSCGWLLKIKKSATRFFLFQFLSKCKYFDISY